MEVTKTNKLGRECAFPVVETQFNGINQNYEHNCTEAGMSKRFYTATIILSGLCANPKNTKISSNIFVRIFQLFFPKTKIISSVGDCDDMVSVSYKMADELLKQE